MRYLSLTLLCLVAVAAIAAEPQTVTKAGTAAPNAVGVQGVVGGIPIPVNASVSIGAVTTSEQSVTSTGANVPSQATYIAGSSSGGKLLAPYVMTSTPSGAEPGFVVRMPAGASGLTNSELRAAPISTSSTAVGPGTATSTPFYVSTINGAAGGGLTNTELRAAPVSVSSTQIADLTQIVGGAVGANGTLSLGRNPDGVAYPLGIGYDNSVFTAPAPGNTWPVSLASAPTTPVTGTFWPQTQTSTISNTVTVTGPLTNAELRASPIPVQATVTSTTITNAVNVFASQSGTWSGVGVTGTFWPQTQTSTITSGAVTATLAAGSAVTSTISGVTVLTNNATAYTTGLPVLVAIAKASPSSTTADRAEALQMSTAGRLFVDFGGLSVTSTLVGQSVTSTGLGQGVSLTGATGPLVLAAVSSTVPSYTTGTVQPLSVSNSGYLRASELSDLTTSATSTTATSATQWIAASGTNKVYIKFAQCSSSAASTTTTNEQCQLLYGTGTNCGTGTTLLAACFTPATGGCNWHDLVAPASSAICFRHAVTGTKLYTISYRRAP